MIHVSSSFATIIFPIDSLLPGNRKMSKRDAIYIAQSIAVCTGAVLQSH